VCVHIYIYFFSFYKVSIFFVKAAVSFTVTSTMTSLQKVSRVFWMHSL